MVDPLHDLHLLLKVLEDTGHPLESCPDQLDLFLLAVFVARSVA